MRATPSPGNADPPLHTALGAYASGIYPLEAGVELLIAHASWLHRDDFIDAFLHTDTTTIDDTELASIDWAGAISALDTGALPCSRGEQRMLRLAASIAGGTPVSLNDTLPGLDHRNTNLLIAALLHASGHQPSNP